MVETLHEGMDSNDRVLVRTPRTMYNSHGVWATLADVREVEMERENGFPDLWDFAPDTPAIWVTRTSRQALRYIELADEWDRLSSGSLLTAEDRKLLREVNRIRVRPGDILTNYDGDGGWLLLRPESESIRGE